MTEEGVTAAEERQQVDLLKMESFDGTAANRILQSDAKTFSSSVEVNTAQLERYLCTIQETLAKHEDSFKLVPLLARKLDLCILDVDVIRDKFYQQEATGIEKYLQVGLTVAHCLSVCKSTAPYFSLHQSLFLIICCRGYIPLNLLFSISFL